MSRPVLLIRANGNDEDAAVLQAAGLETVTEPYLEITMATTDEARDAAERMIARLEAAPTSNAPTWLAITSANALKFLIELVGRERLVDAIKQPRIQFAAVGEASAAKLRELGAEVVLVPKTANSEALAKAMTAKGPGKVVWPRSAIAMKTFPKLLDLSGWVVIDGPVYETNPVAAEPASAKAANNGEFAAVVFRSPSAAAAFAKYVSPATANLKDTAIICLGETTSAAASNLGFTVTKTADTLAEILAAGAIEGAR